MRTIFILFLLISTLAAAQEYRHGQFDGGAIDRVWNQQTQSWNSPIEFWHHYAKTKGGLTWGEGSTYPEYEKVKEFDTFLVQVEGGVCLMEFFHQRWRRANDVRRWDERFNEISGCPKVFD